MLVPPGQTNYFIYYRFDENTDFKAEVATHVPIRPPKTHFFSLPKYRKLPEELVIKKTEQQNHQREKEEVIDRFFTIFKNWQTMSSS